MTIRTFTKLNKISLTISLFMLTSACVNDTSQNIRQADNGEDYMNLYSNPSEQNTSLSEQGFSNLNNRTQAPDVTAENPFSLDYTDAYQPMIWDEFNGNLSLAEKYNGRYDEQTNFYLQNPELIENISSRAKPFIHFILSEVQQRNMPYELALLPMIESGFKPEALSSGGAAGLWQFIPSTADLFGLEHNWWYDGRQDITKSTRVALDYLKELYDQSNSDWLLALAAYNAGMGTVSRAVQKYQNKYPGTQPTFWDVQPYLPTQTQHYVPKLLAVSHAITHYKEFNLSLAPIKNQPFFTEVKLRKQIDLKTAANLSKVPYDLLTELNPGLLQPATPPEGSYSLLIPYNKAKALKSAIAANSTIFNIQWEQHETQSGDTLGGIAKKYNTSSQAIKELNNMTGSRLKSGKTLLIPVPAERAQANIIERAKQNNAEYKGKKTYYTVKAGDTLWNIARYHNIATSALSKWNNINIRTDLAPGTKLEIRDTQKGHQIKHRLKKGESLWVLAKKYNVSEQDIRYWNGISDAKGLRAGRELSIWKSTATQALNSKPTTGTNNSNKMTKHKKYIVRNGDNLWNIAKANNISAILIASYNKLTIQSMLKPGQVIKIPLDENA